MKAKYKHKRKMLEYLSDPDNEVPPRIELARICGIRRETMYAHFSPDELSQIEAEGLELRRKKYAPFLSQIDKAVLARAADGDPQAAKLAYQRFENWSEKQQVDANITGIEKLVINRKRRDGTDDDAA